MRLNLSPDPERYVLVPETATTVPVVIIARPALTDVVQEALSDDALLAFAEAMTEISDAAEQSDEMKLDAIRKNQRFHLAFGKAIARIVIEGWEGVEDPDGSLAPVQPDRIDALLDIAFIWRAFEEKYLTRWLWVQQEKNVSAPSPTGTLEGAKPTAGPAQKSAKSARKGSTARKA